MTLSIYQLKPRFQRLLQPLVGRLARAGVTPNQLTVGTAAAMLAYGTALALWPHLSGLWLGLVVVMPLRMAGNALDGLLARHLGRQTRLGAMLNEVCDLVSDLALTLPFALLPQVNPVLVVLAVVLGAVAEYTGLAALAAGSPRRFDGPMGKSDRAFAYGLLGLMAGLQCPPAWLQAVLVLLLPLLLWTTANRLRRATTGVDRVTGDAGPPTP